MSRVGEKLKALRQKHGLSTRQLGEAVGVDSTYISKIERGERRPSIEVVAELSRYFGVLADILIKDELELDE